MPQAFSHWSHVHGVSILKVGELIICDPQGFYEASSKAFRLVDPVIHSAGEGMRFARTDHGKKGIGKFFETHQCNGLCVLLSLPPVPLCYQAGGGTQPSRPRPIAVVTQAIAFAKGESEFDRSKHILQQHRYCVEQQSTCLVSSATSVVGLGAGMVLESRRSSRSECASFFVSRASIQPYSQRKKVSALCKIFATAMDTAFCKRRA